MVRWSSLATPLFSRRGASVVQQFPESDRHFAGRCENPRAAQVAERGHGGKDDIAGKAEAGLANIGAGDIEVVIAIAGDKGDDPGGADGHRVVCNIYTGRFNIHGQKAFKSLLRSFSSEKRPLAYPFPLLDSPSTRASSSAKANGLAR